MVIKLKILVFSFAVIAPVFINLYPQNVFAATPVEVRDSSFRLLRELGAVIRSRYLSDGSIWMYPENGVGPCAASQGDGKPCWAYELNNQAQMSEDLWGSSHLDVNTEGLKGDIRYRCRTQGHTTYCFLYYCADKKPAGCKQVWRVDWKIDRDSLNSQLFKIQKFMDIPGENWDFLPSSDPTPDTWK